MVAASEEMAPLVTANRKTVRRDINVEMCRFYGYFAYFIMMIVATIITYNFVDYPVPGNGFDPTATFIYQLFGFNHTCSVVDFNPSRTISALLVMLLVVPLIIYVILNRYRIEHEHINGNVGPKLFKFNQIITPLQLIGIGFFYMVFVNQPLDLQSFIFHYIPYQNLQIALALNEIQQIEYLICRKHRGLPLPRLVARMPLALMRAYSAVLVIVVTVYTVFVWSFIAGSPIVDTSTHGGLAFSHSFMYLFNTLAILIPMVSSFLLTDSKYGSNVSIEFTTFSHRKTSTVPRPNGTATVHRERSNNRRQHQVQSSQTIPTLKPNIARPPLRGMHQEYPFENVVFQGGGAKGIAYCGAIQALDELGILPYLKRFAGTSAGCLAAALLALGLDSTQVKKEIDELDMNSFFDGGSGVPLYSKWKKGTNLFMRLGIHPADRCIEYFGDLFERYTGDRDLTFLGLYQRFGTELCITVSNLSRQLCEYCHVNVTPDLPIRLAIRASMSLPFLWEPVQLPGGDKYVDGGVFCNYPLKAFDGFFLSTKSEDGVDAILFKEHPGIANYSNAALLRVIREMSEKCFAQPNWATIGFRVADASSEDTVAYSSHLKRLENRLRNESLDQVAEETEEAPLAVPSTELSRRTSSVDSSGQSSLEVTKFDRAFVELCRWMVLQAAGNPDWVHSDLHPHGIVSAKFLRTLQEDPPGEAFSPQVFGFLSWRDVVAAIDTKGKGYFVRSDLAQFWGRFGVRNSYMRNRKAKSIDSLDVLVHELLNSMLVVSEEALLLDSKNSERTCTLSSFYVGTLDLKLTEDDKVYLYAQGKKDSIAWIKKHASVVNSKDKWDKVCNRFRSSREK